MLNFKKMSVTFMAFWNPSHMGSCSPPSPRATVWPVGKSFGPQDVWVLVLFGTTGLLRTNLPDPCHVFSNWAGRSLPRFPQWAQE